MFSEIPRNQFDLSHDRKMSCEMGKLIPILSAEVLPGDVWKLNTSLVVRISALLAPMMHKVDVFTHFYFVPNRLIWADFEKFITGGEDGLDATAHPYITLAGVDENSLADYLALPIRYDFTDPDNPVKQNFVAGVQVNALPFRAYNLIYNEHYRNTNHQAKVANVFTNGADATSNQTILSRNWEMDYFTSCRPWAQRGGNVTLPLGTSAPVTRVANAPTWKIKSSGAETTPADGNLHNNVGNLEIAGVAQLSLDPNGGLIADLSTATPATINQLRTAFQIQRFMEKNARIQARYVNFLMEHYGVRLDDYRAARPVFLGGGRSPVAVSEVLQTSATDATSPQGNMAGHGFSAANNHAFTQSFQEHGWLIGIMSVMPRTCYQQGLHRSMSRTSKYDYYLPVFAHLGDQAVLKKEIFCDGTAVDDAAVFGYNGRWDEYRFIESTVHGEYRSSLNYWHMGRVFTSRPTLGSTFITSDPTKRMLATPDDSPACLVHLHHNIRALRCLPQVSNPGLIDH